MKKFTYILIVAFIGFLAYQGHYLMATLFAVYTATLIASYYFADNEQEKL